MGSKIIFITGATCSGKSSLKKFILDNTSNIHNLQLHTTRPKRDDEDDSDYIFEIPEQFDEYIQEDRLLEYMGYDTAYGKWFYGTLKDDIKEGKIYIISGSVDALVRYMSEIKEENLDIKIIPIYLLVSKECMRKRYYKRIGRGLNDPEVERRIDDDYKKYNSINNEYHKILTDIPEKNTFMNSYSDKDKLFKIILERVKDLIVEEIV